MNKSLYELLGMKAKYSIFKSVFVTDDYTSEGFRIIAVEPYDDTFLNAISTISKLDKTTDKIFKKVHQYFKGEPVWLCLYTDISHGEYLINDFYMEQWGLLERK
jgi:hypothetical protein